MSRRILAAVVLASVVGSGAELYAQEDYQPINIFPLGISGPTTNLMRAPDGSLYGLTDTEVFRITPQGAYVPVASGSYYLHEYGIWASDGAMHFGSGARVTAAGELTYAHVFPDAQGFSVIQASDGYLYGTTGRDGQFKRGTAYRMTVSGGGFTVLHDFSTAEVPPFYGPGPITEGSDGNFYLNTPVTPSADCCGVIYKMTPDGTLSVFHVFTVDEGRTVTAPLFRAADGALYGLTQGNGAGILASIYRLSDDGHLTILRRFDDSASTGYSVINQFSDGNFYFRVAAYIWRMTPAGAATPLHRALTLPERVRYGTQSFDLVEGLDGNYYGVATGGGGRFGVENAGLVFRLNSRRSRCANVVELLSNNQYLYVTQFIKTEKPAVWGAWLVTRSSIKTLWLLPTPPLTPTVGFDGSFYPFPNAGTVGVLSVLITSEFRVCADWQTVDTGAP